MCDQEEKINMAKGVLTEALKDLGMKFEELRSSTAPVDMSSVILDSICSFCENNGVVIKTMRVIYCERTQLMRVICLDFLE